MSIEIDVPAGVSRGNYMTMSGEGHRGENGTQSGDLVVYFDEKEHELFIREDSFFRRSKAFSSFLDNVLLIFFILI